jgi:peptide/nickel transport system permease protein
LILIGFVRMDHSEPIAEISSDYRLTPRHILNTLLNSRIFKRAARAILVSISVMLISFTLIRIIPGDPAATLLGELATDEAVAELRAQMGIDGTFTEQLIRYLGGFIRGDLGESLASRQPVATIITQTLPVTLWLIGVTLVISLAGAIPLGVLAAIYYRTWFGEAFRVIASLLLAMPVFYSGLLLILFFSIRLDLAPVAGYRSIFPENLQYLWLPALTNATLLIPILARVLQSSIVDTMEEEFVETAIVRGLPKRIYYWRYLIRPSIGPTVSLLAYIVGQLLSAAVLIEIIFGLPGIGTQLIDAVRVRDYTLVQGIVAIFGLIVVVVGFAADVACGLLDPRMKQ